MGFLMKAPSISEENQAESIKRIHSWLYQLNENLRYMFSHLNEENFSGDFLSSLQSNIQTEIENVSQRLEALETGSEWETVSFSGIREWSQVQTPSVKRIGELVLLAGGVSLTSSLSSSGVLLLGVLPEKYRPKLTQIMAVCSDNGLFRLAVNTDGEVRVKNLTGRTFSSGVYLSLSCCYAV